MFDREYAQQLEEAESRPDDNTSITINTKDLPPDLLIKINAYAAKLRRKHPQMKPSRLERRLAEKFNLTIV